MKILVVSPGATFSVIDVHNGLVAALKKSGHEVIIYSTEGHFMASIKYMELAYQIHKMRNPDSDLAEPTKADIFYHASNGLLERTLRLEPAFVLVIGGMYIHPDTIVMLRRAGVPVAALLTESPYWDDTQVKMIKHLNWCYTNELNSVDYLRQNIPSGIVYYASHAYDPEQHKPAPKPAEYLHDVVFVGTGFEGRVALLEGVNWEGINLGLYGVWETVQETSPLYQHIAGGTVDNKVAVELYNQSKIGLNLYRKNVDFEDDKLVDFDAYSMNPRVLELAACETFFLSDDRLEQREVFGSLLPTFNTSAELETLIRYYLDHKDEREAIARRLSTPVKGRTFSNMASLIVETSKLYLRG